MASIHRCAAERAQPGGAGLSVDFGGKATADVSFRLRTRRWSVRTCSDAEAWEPARCIGWPLPLPLHDGPASGSWAGLEAGLGIELLPEHNWVIWSNPLSDQRRWLHHSEDVWRWLSWNAPVPDDSAADGQGRPRYPMDYFHDPD